ncbi:MAG: hypothetical protein LKJ44_01540, partial [Bifidobacteriaceae bacterium]|nr:hypothetical protein [Bifidobacteriaceae bacterium]
MLHILQGRKEGSNRSITCGRITYLSVIGILFMLFSGVHGVEAAELSAQNTLISGDEFNSNTMNPGWIKMSSSASALGPNDTFVYSADNAIQRDGKLEIITERHCLSANEEVSSSNVQESP